MQNIRQTAPRLARSHRDLIEISRSAPRFAGLASDDQAAISTGVGWADSNTDLKVQISSLCGCGRNLIVPSTFLNERNAAARAANAAAAASQNLTCVPTSQDDDRRRRMGRRLTIKDESA